MKKKTEDQYSLAASTQDLCTTTSHLSQLVRQLQVLSLDLVMTAFDFCFEYCGCAATGTAEVLSFQKADE